MRKSSSSYALLTLGGMLVAASCSIIAEVDRTKIPQDDGTTPGDGGNGTGGSNGTGGRGGTSGTGGSSGAGDGGMGGEPSGGTSGTGGDTGGGTGGDAGGGGTSGDAGGGGTGGEGGTPSAVCGDGMREGGEACDDDDTDPGDGCSATCGEESGWSCNTASPSVCTPVCGDGMMVGAEACDDRNNDACGTCNVGCTAAVTPVAATGSITPSATPADGDTFILNDGDNPAVTFEFDSAGGVAGGNTAVDISGAADANAVSDAIETAVNGVTTALAITAANPSPPAVTLTNDRATAVGNTVIGGSNPGGTSYTKTDMAGGVGSDCPATTGCNAPNVCASGDCNSTNMCTG